MLLGLRFPSAWRLSFSISESCTEFLQPTSVLRSRSSPLRCLLLVLFSDRTLGRLYRDGRREMLRLLSTSFVKIRRTEDASNRKFCFYKQLPFLFLHCNKQVDRLLLTGLCLSCSCLLVLESCRRFDELGVRCRFSPFPFPLFLIFALECKFGASCTRAVGCPLPGISFLSVTCCGRNDWDRFVFYATFSSLRYKSILWLIFQNVCDQCFQFCVTLCLFFM